MAPSLAHRSFQPSHCVPPHTQTSSYIEMSTPQAGHMHIKQHIFELPFFAPAWISLAQFGYIWIYTFGYIIRI